MIDSGQRTAGPAAGRGPRGLRRAGGPELALLLALSAGAVLCLYQTRGTTLSFDEWEWALGRRGASPSTFLDPHNGHFSLVPLLIYKTLFVTAGIRHYLPYRLLATAAHLTCVTLVYVHVRRRLGAWPGVVAAAWLLFLGAAWQNFLWPFQLAWLISIACGLGMLLALERGDRRGDAIAALLLGGSLASSGIGMAVAAGACVRVLGAPAPRRRGWLLAVPLGLFGLWWIGYQQAATSGHALGHAPVFVAKVASATMAGLAGLAGNTIPYGSGTLLRYGPPLAVLGVLAVAAALVRGRRGSANAYALMAIVGSFWVLAALGRSGLAQPYSSRYLYVGAAFLIPLGGELLRGVRPPAWLTALATALIAVAIVSGVGMFSDAGAFERGQAQATVADLGALEIVRGLVPPGYVPADFPGFGLRFSAGAYFAMERDIGTPAASPGQLARLPEGPRFAADQELIAAGDIALRPAPPGSVCPPPARARPGASISIRASAVTPLLIVAGSGPATVSVARFAGASSKLGTVLPGQRRVLRIAADRSTVWWRAQISGVNPRVCAGRSH